MRELEIGYFPTNDVLQDVPTVVVKSLVVAEAYRRQGHALNTLTILARSFAQALPAGQAGQVAMCACSPAGAALAEKAGFVKTPKWRGECCGCCYVLSVTGTNTVS